MIFALLQSRAIKGDRLALCGYYMPSAKRYIVHYAFASMNKNGSVKNAVGQMANAETEADTLVSVYESVTYMLSQAYENVFDRDTAGVMYDHKGKDVFLDSVTVHNRTNWGNDPTTPRSTYLDWRLQGGSALAETAPLEIVSQPADAFPSIYHMLLWYKSSVEIKDDYETVVARLKRQNKRDRKMKKKGLSFE